MNREYLWSQADEIVRDAEALLAASRWSAAYYLVGYAVECALKACVLAHLDRTGAIFEGPRTPGEQSYLKKLEKCWTHDLELLMDLADLREEWKTATNTNSNFKASWTIVMNWKVTSRYDRKTEQEARDLWEAITQEPDGVLQWLRQQR